MAPLGLGVFTPPIIVCPWHNEAFDVRTGKRVDGGRQPALEVFPVTVRNGTIAVALPVAWAAGSLARAT
jgi:nitrite reductase/ring-hydroxylating ferredoxin subunit